SELIDESTYRIISEDELDCLTNDKEKVMNLIDYLALNQVSPYHLIDIAGEFADEWVDDFDRTLKEKFKEYAIA
ncbi:MAG: DUF6514 family protein, partial [Caloramator sp.]|nr:DUF6514 family protein [Caloramator sp.]